MHEIFHGSVIGLIEKISLESSDYGKQWAIVLDTTQVGKEPEKTILKIGIKNSYAKGIIWSLPNIDLNDDVMIKPYAFTPKGEDKERVGNTVYQWSEAASNWSKVAQAYSKDRPNGLPKLKEMTLDGEKKWDRTKRNEFLEKMVLSFFPEGEKIDPFQNSVEQFEEEGQPQAAEEPHDPPDRDWETSDRDWGPPDRDWETR